MYFTYIIRCEDNSLYTGFTNNLYRRMTEHYNQTMQCARYTKSHKMKNLEIAWSSSNKNLAFKLEFYIKRLSKNEKELIITNRKNFNKILKNFVNIKEYRKISYLDITNINNSIINKK